MPKYRPAKFLQKIKKKECAAELPFLSPVKIIFQKFSFFFTDTVADMAVRYIFCAHAILCAPTVI